MEDSICRVLWKHAKCMLLLYDIYKKNTHDSHASPEGLCSFTSTHFSTNESRCNISIILRKSLVNAPEGTTFCRKETVPPVLPMGLYRATIIKPCSLLRALPIPSSVVDFHTICVRGHCVQVNRQIGFAQPGGIT